MRAFVFSGLLALLACLQSSTGPRQLIGEGTPILFVGNSLTLVHDVPGMVQAFADSAGESVAVATVAFANAALIDHWKDGTARSEIVKRRWAFVVLQQGWTPAGVCRDTLRLATQRFATPIRQAGARPVLFQAWAPRSRPGQQLGTIESYQLAAEDVDGLLLPVAEAWLAVARRDSTIDLYLDDIHANDAGAYLTALVMFTRFFERTPVGLPAAIRTRSGSDVRLAPGLARLLQDAAAEVALPPTAPARPIAPALITSRC
jgi:hypothetical protein